MTIAEQMMPVAGGVTKDRLMEVRVSETADDIATRIDQLPYSRWHTKVLGIIGTANFFDAFDGLTIAFVMPVLVTLWALSPTEVGLLISAGYIGQLIGSLVFSTIAERFGRRPALVWTIWIVSGFSLACALSWNYLALVLFRIVQGVGLGGELPVASTYLSEVIPSKVRGKIYSFTQSFFALGVFGCALIGTWVIPRFGWQSLFLLGAIPCVFAIILRRFLPESPRWLANKGRLTEANAIVAAVEVEIQQLKNAPKVILQGPPSVKAFSHPISVEPSEWSELLSEKFRLRTIAMSVAMFCASVTGFGLMTWMPTVYRTIYKLPVEQALNVSLTGLASLFLSMMCFAFIVDKLGRRLSFFIGFGGSAVALIVLQFVAQTATLFEVVTLASIGQFFIAFLLGGCYLYSSEIYPTRIRVLSAGLVAACIRIGSIVGPPIVGLILSFSNINMVFLLFACSSVIGAATVFLCFIEMKGRPLEENI